MTTTGKIDLFDMEFDEVSFVPSGDNPSAHIVLSKVSPDLLDLSKKGPSIPKGTKAHAFSADPDGDGDMCATCGGSSGQHKAMFGKVSKAVPGATVDDLQETIDGWDMLTLEDPAAARDLMLEVATELEVDDETVALINALPVSKASGGTTTKKTQRGGTVALTDEQEAFITGLPEDQQDIARMVAEGVAGDDGGTTEVITTEDDDALALAKANPAVARLLEKAATDTAEATRIAKEERDLRVGREMVAKAETLTHLQGTVEEKTQTLSKAYESGDDVGDALFSSLTAANRQVEASDEEHFRAFGKAAPGQAVGTKAQEVDDKAKELMKADSNLTIEAARVKVYKAEPTLYVELQKEASHAG
jgi:hypothetical protein